MSGTIQAVPTQTKPTVYISFSAEIVVQTTEALINAFTNCVNQGYTDVCLLLSSPGGSVMHGITLFNTLRGMPINLTTHNVGNVDSIGNVVFLAGKTRYACAHSTFMFHGVGIDSGQGVRMDEKILRERLNGLKADQARIGSVLVQETTITKESAEALFLEAQTKDATFALGSGIVHEIREVKIPMGSPVVTLVFNR